MKYEELLSNKEFNNRIIDNIKMFSKKKGLSIGYLEKSIGVSPGYISRMRSGKKVCINAYYIYIIINILDIDIKDLLEERDWEYVALKEKADELGYELVPRWETSINDKED